MKKRNKAPEEKTQDINTESVDNKGNQSVTSDNDLNITNDSSSDQAKQPVSDKKGDKVPLTDKIEKELNDTLAKLAEMQDKYIRLSAEFDNYRKRTLREKIDLSKYAGEDLLLKIIPLMDDFERALNHMEDASDCAAMKNGIELIYTKFDDFLKQSGVKEIEAINSSFNVDIHEAIAKTPVNEDDKKGKVVDVILKGYYLQDKVLRFSKVVVGE